MREVAAFLEAIVNNPDDDTARLVFADWLDEQGSADDAARAEFIRVQCELARLDRDDPRVAKLKRCEKYLLKRTRRNGPRRWHRTRGRWSSTAGSSKRSASTATCSLSTRTSSTASRPYNQSSSTATASATAGPRRSRRPGTLARLNGLSSLATTSATRVPNRWPRGKHRSGFTRYSCRPTPSASARAAIAPASAARTAASVKELLSGGARSG